MAKKIKGKSPSKEAVRLAPRQRRATGQRFKPVARWRNVAGIRRLILENGFYRIELCPEKGGAITSYVDRASGIDIIWRNPYGQPPRMRVLDQPMSSGSDLYDVMDGSWYVSLPNGFFAGDYFGAPLGTHGELRALPWTVESLHVGSSELRVTLVGRSVRTPFVYRRQLTMQQGSGWLFWQETVENRAAEALPVAWLQHPTFGGPLLENASLITPAKAVRVFRAETPESVQLKAGYEGSWPHVPERESGEMRDCSAVLPAGSGKDHSVQLTDFDAGWGCIWNASKRLGFAMEWDVDMFPYAWSWNSAGGVARYPLWGEGHIITLQPSTSPVGRFADLLKQGEVLFIPARGAVTTTLATGFVDRSDGPWTTKAERSRRLSGS